MFFCLFIHLFFLLKPVFSLAFILKPSTIIQKMAEGNGSGVYQIEQDVQFLGSSSGSSGAIGADGLALHETWFVESEKKMKLIVTNPRPLAEGKIHWVFLYENGQKTVLVPGRISSVPLGDEFIEKYFHFREPESFQNSLVRLGILPSFVFNKNSYHKSSKGREIGLDVVSDPHIRLARVGGVVAYRFGLPAGLGTSSATQKPKAAFFIEQDQFLLRKFRLPSGVEVRAESFSTYPRGLNFPRHRTVRWEDRQVSIQTYKVISISKKAFLDSHFEQGSPVDGTNLGEFKNLVEEFYTRFR